MPGEESENPSTETTDSSKKTGKSKAIDLDLLTAALASLLATEDGVLLVAASIEKFFATPPNMGVLASELTDYFCTPEGGPLLDNLIGQRLPKATLVEFPETQPTTSTSVDTNQFACLFGIPAADIFNCRHYADEGRYVVVTVDGRKLEMSQAEADHAA